MEVRDISSSESCCSFTSVSTTEEPGDQYNLGKCFLDSLEGQVGESGGELLIQIASSDLELLKKLPSESRNVIIQPLVEVDNNTVWCYCAKEAITIEQVLEVKVAVIGNVDAGKSTMLGVLSGGQLDDGRGKARQGLFRHKHEAESGRTSSVGQEVLSFSEDGQILRNSPGRKGGFDEITPSAHKIISFSDLAGHERYLKTTMHGLTGGSPDYAMLMVGANSGLIGMAKEHLALAFAIAAPLFVVITKIDISPSHILEGTIRQIHKLMRSPATRRNTIEIQSKEDVIFAARNMTLHRICPIFQLSNVTGQGIELLSMFLRLLPIKPGNKTTDAIEFPITDVYSVPGVGTVVAGNVLSGSIQMGQVLYLGPDHSGRFLPTQVKGIQRKRVNVSTACAGQSASLALKKIKKNQLRKGMILLSKSLALNLNPNTNAWVCNEFEAEIRILFHSTTISTRYQAMLHCGVVRQTVSIVCIKDAQLLRSGDRAIVRFRFVHYPEYIKVGARILFREGRTKGMGKIVGLGPAINITD